MSQEHENRELISLRIIRSETVLSRYPLHRLSKTSDGVNVELRRVNEYGEVNFSWKVSYTNEYGQPGPLAYKLDTLVINRRIEEAGVPMPRMIRLGSLRDIAEELGLGRDTNSVKKALHQNASAYIVAKVRYTTKSGREKAAEFGKNRYGVIFAGERLSDGTVADSVYIELNDWYRDILDTARMRPLDYDYLKELPPTAQRLYELLSYRVFAALKHEREEAKYLYSEFCAFAPQTRYFEYDKVKKQMYKVHAPHKKAGFIVGAEFKETTDDEGQRDWEILYKVGPKAKAEHRIFTRRREALPAAAAAGEGTDEEQSLVMKLLQHGLDERTARDLVRNDAAEVAVQLELFPYRDLGSVENPTGWLIEAIRKKYKAPKNIAAKKAKVEKELQARRRQELKKAKEAHRERCGAAFAVYLGAKLGEIERTHSEAYRAFNEEYQQFTSIMRDLQPETTELMRIYEFERFTGENPGLGVLTFWEWDKKMNPEPFREEGRRS